MMSAADSLARCISLPLMLLDFFYTRETILELDPSSFEWGGRTPGGSSSHGGVVVGASYLGGLLLEVRLAGLIALVATSHDGRLCRSI